MNNMTNVFIMLGGIALFAVRSRCSTGSGAVRINLATASRSVEIPANPGAPAAYEVVR